MDAPEGATPLDPDELGGLKFRHITTRGELDQMEQANIQEGLIWLQKHRHRDILSEHFLRQLHGKLFGNVWGWAGSFRQTEKNIGIDPVQIPMQLRDLLEDAKYWVENEIYPPSELALRLHHRLVKIHPFPNGNGRHARILADLVLTNILGNEPISWGNNLDADSEAREEYINALRQADLGNYEQLIELYCVD